MKVTIKGIRPVDFVADDGRSISGTSVYVTFKTDGVTGEATDRYFVKADVASAKDLVVGKEAEIYFNSKGKVDMIYIV